MSKTMPAELAQSYGVFRREARPSDSIDEYIAADGTYARELGMNRTLARRITTSSEQTTKVWVVPIADGTCLMFLLHDR